MIGQRPVTKGSAKMKRFHIHVGVKNLEASVLFYTTLFGQPPTKLKVDYAKWMLEDPRINFAISTRTDDVGADHLGIQVDEDAELEEITQRLKAADLSLYDEGETTCCYADSKKAWVKDPSGVAWETYRTMADAEVFSGRTMLSGEPGTAACCVSEESDSSCC